MRAVAGLSAQAIGTGMNSDIRNAQAALSQAPTPESVHSVDGTKGAMVASFVAPGIAPVIGARVGAGGGFEGGVTYLGRGGRIDMRKAFSNKSFALSIGAGFDAVFLGRSNDPIPWVDASALDAFGFDVPIIVGWRSTAGLYQVWAGARGGYDHGTITARSTEPTGLAPTNGTLEMSADHFYAGGLVGLAIGLRHIHVALELDASYVVVTGTFSNVHASTGGLVLTPASAISWDF